MTSHIYKSAAKWTGRKVIVKNPVVEIDGDEMAQVMWKMIRERLIKPYLDIKLDYYDLSLQNRDRTDDKITYEAAYAIKKHKIGVKCATITPDKIRSKEYKLKKIWPSPNSTIRDILNGTLIREAVICKNIPKLVPGWTKTIIIASHSQGDVIQSTDFKIQEAGQLEIVFTPKSSNPTISMKIHNFDDHGGCALGMFNSWESINRFAHHTFDYALLRNLPVMLGTKDTQLVNYDGYFKDIFHETFEKEYKAKFEEKGIWYEHRPIDDLMSQLFKSHGGFIIALKNYDGDVQSSLIAQGFGSVGMMVSQLICDDGVFESEATHGTIPRHFKIYSRGWETSVNSVASIFAWTRALSQRGILDRNQQLIQFAKTLEDSVIETVEGGYMTLDLAQIIYGQKAQRSTYLNTEEFIDEINGKLQDNLYFLS